MKNPLRKRIPRELKGEFGKYLVVFILMVTTIGMVSGFLVADGSMIQPGNLPQTMQKTQELWFI